MRSPRSSSSAFADGAGDYLLHTEWIEIASANRLEGYEKTAYYPLLAAARSWREGRNVAENAPADRFADVAIKLKIEPTSTSEAVKKSAEHVG